MALVRKGSRLITVDGVVYRWRVRKRPTYARGIADSPLSFAVEQADQRGAVLIASMPAAHPANWVGAPALPVVPSLVAAMIRRAREQGWQPDQPGSAFTLTAGPEIWSSAATA